MLGFTHLEMVELVERHHTEVLLDKFHRREKGKDVEEGYEGVMVKVSHRI